MKNQEYVPNAVQFVYHLLIYLMPVVDQLMYQFLFMLYDLNNFINQCNNDPIKESFSFKFENN